MYLKMSFKWMWFDKIGWSFFTQFLSVVSGGMFPLRFQGGSMTAFMSFPKFFPVKDVNGMKCSVGKLSNHCTSCLASHPTMSAYRTCERQYVHTFENDFRSMICNKAMNVPVHSC